jgi:hypothetical protein
MLLTGWNVVGFDIQRPARFPAGASFVQQDIATIDGARWRGRVKLIVASPPCNDFSQCHRFARVKLNDPERGMVLVRHCFRIAREAEAPIVVENVQGARPFIDPEFGPSTWHAGSFYFWGEPPILKPHGRFVKNGWFHREIRLANGKTFHSMEPNPRIRSSAERAIVPIEIAHAVGSQFLP